MRRVVPYLLKIPTMASAMRAPQPGTVSGAVASWIMKKANRQTSIDVANRLQIEPTHSVLEIGKL
jgi:hypothetical protein